MELRRALHRVCSGSVRAALLVGLLLGLTAPALTACTPTPPKRVLMYGDSITYESTDQLKARGIEVHAFGGTALCDWFTDMRREAATHTVGTVYLEFVGNYFTPCVRTRPQLTAYRDDAAAAVYTFRMAGARVVWVRPPEPRPAATLPPAGGTLKAAALRDAELTVLQAFDQVQAAELTARPNAVVDTSPLIAPNRVFTPTLPCRGSEPCEVLAPKGFDAARAPDGLHLCPTQLRTLTGVVGATCSVYSTSAARFAEQVAAVR